MFRKTFLAALVSLAIPAFASATTPVARIAPDSLPRYSSPDAAPDAISREILSHPILAFEEGSTGTDDMLAAIERNYPKIIEQNVASMPPKTAAAWLDQLSDLEIEHIAQLYVNANSNTARTGKLLYIWASRLDGAHLAHVARYFGYDAVYSAILEVAPIKAQSFAASAAIRYAGPVAGAPLSAKQAVFLGTSGGVTPMAGFSPQTSMTFQQLYTGFRSMQTGSMGATAAVYELVEYSGKRLIPAFGYGYGYAIGSGITYIMQEYTPDFYYNTFVPAVGGSIYNASNYIQNVAITVWNYTASTTTLGNYQKATLPIFGVSTPAQNAMGNTGGDYQMEYEYSTVVGGGCHPYCIVAH